jgi:hypothetical protein
VDETIQLSRLSAFADDHRIDWRLTSDEIWQLMIEFGLERVLSESRSERSAENDEEEDFV